MARRGKISEVFSLEDLEKQQQRAVDLVMEFVDVVSKVKPIAIKLQGAEKTKEVIDGVRELGTATNQIVDVYGRTISAINSVETTTKKLTTAYRDNAKANDESAKNVKKQDDAYAQLSRQHKEAERNARNMAIQFGVESKEALEAAQAADVLRQKLEAANNVTRKKTTTTANEPASSPASVPEPEISTDKIDLYAELNKQFKEAELNARNLAIQYGVDSKEAIEAANAASLLAAKLDEVKNVVKNIPKQADTDVPFTTNLEDLQREKEGLEGVGVAVTEVDRAQADNVMTANEWASSQKVAAEQTNNAADSFERIATPLEKYTGTLEENLRLNRQYQARISEVGAELRALDKNYSDAEKNTEGYKNKVTELLKEQSQLKQASSELRLTLTDQVKFLNAAEGSYDQLNATLNLSRKVYKALTDEEKASPFGLELSKNIVELDANLKKQDATMGVHTRHVGDYAGSAKIIVDALERQKIKVAELNEKFGETHPAAQAAGRELQGLQRIVENPQFLNVAAKIGDSNAELRQFTKNLIELEQKGLGNTDFANDLRKHLAELKDQIGDTREEIKAMSSDTRSFDQLSSAVNLLTNTYQTFLGAQALFGEQTEENEETIKRLVAVQSLANGLQQISEELTKRGTLANKAYVAIQGLMATAMDKTAASSLRAAAATKLLLGGLVIGALAFIVIKMNEWASAAARVVTQQKVLNDVTRAAADNYGKEKAQLDVLIATIRTEGISRKEKFAALKELQTHYPGYFDDLRTEADLNNKLEEAYQKAANGILLKAQAQAAGDLLAQNAAKRLKAEVEYNELVKKGTDLLNEQLLQSSTGNRAARDRVVTESFINRKKEIDADYQAAIKAIDENDFFLIKKIQESNLKIQQLGGVVTPTKETNPKKNKTDQIDKDLQAEFETYKLNKERLSALFKESAEDEELSYQQREMNLVEFIRTQQSLIADQAAFDLQNKNLTAKEKVAIEQKAIDAQIKVADEGRKILEKIHQNYLSSLKKDNAEVVAVYSSTYSKLHNLLTKYYDDQEKKRKENEKLEEEGNQRIKDAKFKLAEELKNLAFDLLTNNIENEKNQIQEQIDLLEERKQKEIETANQTILNEQDKAAAIATIEARANAQREQFERRKRQLDVERAKFEKAKAIVEIIQQTTIGIISAQKYPPPLNGILAALIAGIGAAQLARTVAQPIPKYAEGTEDHPGGPAIVGDGKIREYVQTPDGTIYETPATDTVVDLPKHSKVFKDKNELLENFPVRQPFDEFKLLDAMHAQHMTSTLNKQARMPNDFYQFQNLSKSVDRLNKGMDKMRVDVVRAVEKIPQPVIQAVNPVKKWVHSSGSTEYL